MISHKLRVSVLTGLVVLALTALSALVYLGRDATELAVVSGALSVLLPALLDALGVERRRRDPSMTGLVDDVIDRFSEGRDAGKGDEQGKR